MTILDGFKKVSNPWKVEIFFSSEWKKPGVILILNFMPSLNQEEFSPNRIVSLLIWNTHFFMFFV